MQPRSLDAIVVSAAPLWQKWPRNRTTQKFMTSGIGIMSALSYFN